MTTIHRFADKFAEGVAAEEYLNVFFSQFYRVIPTPDIALQRKGIDAIWVKDGRRRFVEYKTDSVTATTGNCFIELVSNDAAGKAGWAYTSQAEWLVYYVPGMNAAWVLSMEKIRQNLPEWERKYQRRRALNPGYASVGVLVPLAVVTISCTVKEFTLP